MKATPSIDRLLNLKKGNKMMERFGAAGKVSREKGLFETAVTALAYQVRLASLLYIFKAVWHHWSVCDECNHSSYVCCITALDCLLDVSSLLWLISFVLH